MTPPEGTITSLLAEHADGTVHPTRDGRYGKRAVTHYRTLGSSPAGHGAGRNAGNRP